ncbi:unnamed protein product [Larinioides sclopetarius]|uniref:Uncharacterized protein n=1 Tax=Larinioides sclopetarius TaxID=280406 RepID=A0AAV2AR92_9ARAC
MDDNTTCHVGGSNTELYDDNVVNRQVWPSGPESRLQSYRKPLS